MRFEFIVDLGLSGFNFTVNADDEETALKLAYIELAKRGIKNKEICNLGYIEF